MHSWYRVALKCFVTCICLSQSAIRCESVFAQAGLRDALTKLDKDEDGRIGPDEITPLARPYLERIAKAKRLSLYRENDISEFQEASRIYHAMQNGVASGSVRPSRRNDKLVPFEPDDDMELVPEFGIANVKYKYIQDDVDEAERTLRRCDEDDDGFITRREARRNRWTHIEPFESDLNGDNRLSKMELIQRYARRRLLDDAAGELIQRARRVGNGIEPSRRDRDDDRRDSSSWWRRGGSSHWLSASIMGRFDKNRNGRLEPGEQQDLGMPVGMLDVDRDGDVTRDELFQYTNALQEEIGDPGKGLPGWFYELDKNRDEQVSMEEFTDDWTEQKIQEFAMLDTNEDGLLTTDELLKSKTTMGGTFTNDIAEMIPPRKTMISEIEVTEDLEIADLNLRLSITHTNVGSLDGYLTGPDGQRIELFTDVGGSGDHFQETTFDDQSGTPITKARAPFEGSFMPEGKLKRQPSFEHWNGKNAKGVWQLVIRGTRNERFGMLHEWRLMFRAKDSMVGESFLASLENLGKEDENLAASSPSGGSQQNSDAERRARYEEQRREAERRAKEDRGKAAAQAWVNSAGPEQAKKRQEMLDRWNSYVEKAKAEGREITGEDKRRIFADATKSVKSEKADKKSWRKEQYDREKIRKEKSKESRR